MKKYVNRFSKNILNNVLLGITSININVGNFDTVIMLCYLVLIKKSLQ